MQYRTVFKTPTTYVIVVVLIALLSRSHSLLEWWEGAKNIVGNEKDKNEMIEIYVSKNRF